MAQQTLDKNNVLVTGELEGSFHPAAQMEIPRDVILKEPFYVKGGVYGQNIRNNGAGTVTGPVMAGREITLTAPPEHDKPINFLSGINATYSIMVEEKAFPLEQTVVNDIEQAGIIVRGDVISDIVRLENALIIGNVRSRQAFLKNSMIVGSAMVEEELHLTNSTFISFSAGRATLSGQNSCWLPYGISGQPIQFEEEQLTDGNTTKAELRYIGLCHTEAFGCCASEGNICCEQFLSKQCEYPSVCLGAPDIHPHTTGDSEQFYALTLARRALNMEKIKEELQRVQKFLKELLLYEHLDDASKQQAAEMWNEQYHTDELAILTLGTEVSSEW